MLESILFEEKLDSLIRLNLKQPIVSTVPHLAYGEIKIQSLLKIIRKIDWSPEDVFCDFGSGYGKVLWHILELTCITKIIGLEYEIERHQIAKQIFNYLTTRSELLNSKVKEAHVIIERADFLESSLVKEATIIYAASTCFGSDLMIKISQLIEQLPKVRLVLTFRPLCGVKAFVLKARYHIECSWDSAFCYVYQKRKNIDSNL